MLPRVFQLPNIAVTIDFDAHPEEDFFEFPIRVFYDDGHQAKAAFALVRNRLSPASFCMAHEILLPDSLDLPLLLLAGGVRHILEMLPYAGSPSDLERLFGFSRSVKQCFH